MAPRAVGALLLVLAVGTGALWLLRRRRPGGLLLSGAGQQLQVLDTRRIGARGLLVVVRWNAEHLLLSHGDGGTVLIARAPAPASAHPEST